MTSFQKVAVAVRPFDDECLMGYIIRVSEINGYPTPTWVTQLWGSEISNKSPLSLSDHTSGMSICLRQDKAVLERTLIRNIDNENHRVLLPSGDFVRYEDLSLKEVRVCECCLHEFGYIRWHWTIKAIPVCHIHGVTLRTHCSSCKTKFRHLRPTVKCLCGNRSKERPWPLLKEERDIIDWHIQRWSSQGKLKKNRVEGFLPPKGYSELPAARQLAVLKLLRASAVLREDQEEVSTTNQDPLFGFRLLGDWPYAYHAHLRNIVDRSMSKVTVFHLKSHFNTHYRAVLESKHLPGYSMLWAEIKNFMDALIGEIPVNRRGNAAALPEEEKAKYISRQTAAQKLKMSKSKLRNLVGSGIIVGQSFRYANNTKQFLCAESVEAYSELQSRALTLGETEKLLGVTAHVLSQLIRAKLIRKIPVLAAADRSLSSRIDRRSIEELIDQLSEISSPFDGGRISEFTSLPKAVAKYNANGVSMLDIIQFALCYSLPIWRVG